MSYSKELKQCRYKDDCFANIDGKCNCLSKTYFKRGVCPFYKCHYLVNTERIEQDVANYNSIRSVR